MKYLPSDKPKQSIKNKTGNWRTYRPVFLAEKCTGCATCEKVCPEGIIYNTKEKNSSGKERRAADLDYCKGCGLCAKNCPFGAIKMEREIK